MPDAGARAAANGHADAAHAIPITKPVFGDEEARGVLDAFESGWIVQGPWVAEFERRFCGYTGAAYATATSSCTTALQVAVAALGLDPGAEVIVPAFTWVSTANVVEAVGARPVFCDVDLRTYNLDVEHCAALIGPRTVGIIPVHLFGLCADIAAVIQLASKHGLWVLEDAACGFGALYRGRHAGTFGDAGCFSFHPRKSITTGEGGMLTTQRREIDRLARSLRDHGASRSDYARHQGRGSFLLPVYDVLGFNYRLTDLQAAVGCAQMDRADWILKRRRELAARYDQLLAGVEWLRRPFTPDGNAHAYQAYVCLFAPEEPSVGNLARLSRLRDELMRRLERDAIATRQGTHAAALVGYYRDRYGTRPEHYPRAATAESLTIALPLYPQMSDEEQARVVDALLFAAP